jgi:hypothetical protein
MFLTISFGFSWTTLKWDHILMKWSEKWPITSTRIEACSQNEWQLNLFCAGPHLKKLVSPLSRVFFKILQKFSTLQMNSFSVKSKRGVIPLGIKCQYKTIITFDSFFRIRFVFSERLSKYYWFHFVSLATNKAIFVLSPKQIPENPLCPPLLSKSPQPYPDQVDLYSPKFNLPG